MVLVFVKNGKREDEATIQIIVETNFQVRATIRVLCRRLLSFATLLIFLSKKGDIRTDFFSYDSFFLLKQQFRAPWNTTRNHLLWKTPSDVELPQRFHPLLLNVTRRHKGGGVHAIEAALCDA